MKRDSQWIPIGEAAKYLGISRDTLRRWEKRGKLKTVRSPSNRRYYTKEQLDNLLGGKSETKIKEFSADTTPSSPPAKTSGLKRTSATFIAGLASFLITVFLGLSLLYLLLR